MNPATIESLIYGGLAITFVLWLGSAAFVVVDRRRYDRREGGLTAIIHQLTTQSLASLPAHERSGAIRSILARKSRRAVYRMVARTELPIWVNEICAAYAVEKWGLLRILRDAAPHRVRRRWRRISALFALAHTRSTKVHELLRIAVFDPDPEVAGAAVVVLQRRGDRRAAEILIAALRDGSYSPSRIATQLEKFAIPIHDLLEPLLVDPRPRARYWGAALLKRYSGVPRLEAALAALTEDPDPPVRKVALETLGAMSVKAAAVAGKRLLGDPAHYVRSEAIRALVRLGMQVRETGSRRALAALLVRSLADQAWEVRRAAKEGLVALGPDVWREVAAQLDAPDAFARNGAAEVLQNLYLLDQAMSDVGRGIEPSAELFGVLARAFREGGHAMVDATIARSKPESAPAVEELLSRLRLTAVRTA